MRQVQQVLVARPPRLFNAFWFASVVAALLLLLLAPTAHAQGQATTGNSSASGSTLRAPPIDAMIASAWSMLRSVDEGKAESLWAEGSDAMKQSLSLQRFVQEANTTRERTGALRARQWVQAISGVLREPGKADAAVVAITFASSFTNMPSVTETVQFRLQGETWRFNALYLDRPQR